MIKKTHEVAGMLDYNQNAIPAVPAALGTCKDREPMNEKWNCRTIVSMLSVETPGLTLPWQHPKHVGSRQLQEATRLCCSTGKLARTSVSSDTPSSGQAK